jgi:hypothetical protein
VPNGEYLHIGVTLVVGLIAYLGNRNVNFVENGITEAKTEIERHDERLRLHGEAIAYLRAKIEA